MLYYLFTYLDKAYDFPGAGLFQYISFRAAMAIIVSLLISMIFGKTLIDMLRRKQVGETIRELGLEGQNAKQGTPTMGGIIILAAILVPTLLFARIGNVYVILMLITTLWMGGIGFLDDYIKVFRKNKEGLAGRFKIMGQVILGLFVGIIMYNNDNVVVREQANFQSRTEIAAGIQAKPDTKSTKTNLPFYKDNEFDYGKILKFVGFSKEKSLSMAWLVFIPIVIIIITAVSNGANITDGLDGLATGTSAIIATTLAILAYLSGNLVFADYLNIIYIPNSGELVIFGGALLGACIGFLWYNSFPAQVFMGDTGSLALGGIIATFAIIIRKELLIPILCGVFLVENLSVMIQVGYFKYTKKRYGEGRRVFKMSPLHHHYQKLGYPETKIVTRFWIIGIILAVVTVVTLKLR